MTTAIIWPILVYLFALAITVYEAVMPEKATRGSRWWRVASFEYWWHHNVPQWVSLVVGTFEMLLVGIAVSPLAFGFMSFLTFVSRLRLLSQLPDWIQVVVPSVVILFGIVALRSPLSRVDRFGHRIIGMVFAAELVLSNSRDRPLPLWALSTAVATGIFLGWAAFTPWLKAGRKLGVWATLWRAVTVGREPAYGPGSYWGERPPKWYGWRYPAGYGQEDQSASIPGAGRVASIEEIKKGGLLS